ncbi:MAG: S8 family serine peptidase, partial [Candidatus Cloacimonadales bacterium]
YESNDHGTHVAGCAGAVGDNEIGLVGSSLNVKIMGTRHAPTFMDHPYVQNGYDGITYCVDSGAQIINCSWGGPGSGTMPNSVINYATSNGALVVAAAGNSNTEHTVYHQDYPSDATNAMSVAATDQYDNKAGFSDFGEPIDISAPGVGIQSTIIGGSGYSAFNGTSMASPVVAGVAALVLSMNPDLQPLELRGRLMDTADNIDANNEDYIGLLGAGRVNAFRATLYDHIPNLTIQSVNFSESDELSDGDGNPNPGEIALIELEIANASFEGGTWADAANVEFTVTSDNPQVSFLEGTENFTVAQISGGESISTSSNPIKIQIPEESNIQQLELILQVSANQTAETPYYATHPFEVVFNLNQAGWPYDLGSGTKSSPVIASFAGEKRAIFGDSSGNVHVMNADGTATAGFPVNIGGSITSAVAVGDLDNDGSNEIVAAAESGSLVAIDSEGEIIFEYALAGMIKSNPIIADVNGNGNREVIAVTLIGEQMVVLNADGSDFGNFPISLSDGGTLASAAVGDLDGNGSLEVLVASVTGQLYAIDTSTASNLANWPVDIGSSSGGGPIVANINNDNHPEVVVSTASGNLFAFTHEGAEIFSRSVGCQVKGSPVISDINDNGSANIIIGANNGTLLVMDNSGADLPGFPMNLTSAVDSTPVLADIDSDGAMDIIFGTADGYLHALNFNGVEARNFPYHTGSSVDTSAALGDLDGDGDLEIIVPNSSQIVVLDFKEAVSNIEWSCLKKNPQRTGNYVEFTTYSQPNETPQLVNSLDNNYPNPFNPTTNISFSLQQAGEVKLHIYNAKGQLVKTLVNEHLSSGRHRVVWNGSDQQQNSAASGIYFYRLQTAEFDSMKKMVLIK